MNNVAFNLFGRNIYWYGIIITCGLLLSVLLAKKDKEKYGISWDDITSFLIYAIIVGFICARVYYVIFQWDYYSLHLDEIIKIWNGGIAIYGGVIGAIITGFIFCKVKKINFLKLCDFCAPYLALAQSIGRWGNFVNREAYGGMTNSFLRMGIFDSSINEYIFVHPTFLYESIANLLIFLLLLCVKKKQKFTGQIFYLYMILYGLARSVIEGLRTDSLYLGNFRISQLLAIAFILLFSTLYLLQREKNKKEM
ncbi:MAG: prolipoprotein diacylglyceryl transferase [Clostridia bacterium]|nr:prolipoprotein diacylglyceryl transferase [Clostridia bacterium]